MEAPRNCSSVPLTSQNGLTGVLSHRFTEVTESVFSEAERYDHVTLVNLKAENAHKGRHSGQSHRREAHGGLLDRRSEEAKQRLNDFRCDDAMRTGWLEIGVCCAV